MYVRDDSSIDASMVFGTATLGGSGRNVDAYSFCNFNGRHNRVVNQAGESEGYFTTCLGLQWCDAGGGQSWFVHGVRVERGRKKLIEVNVYVEICVDVA